MTDSVSSGINTDGTIHTWSDLAGLVEKYRADRWIFRGVQDASDPLVPSIGRPGTRKDMGTGLDLPFDGAEELAMLERFQREVHPHSRTKTAWTPMLLWPTLNSGLWRSTTA